MISYRVLEDDRVIILRVTGHTTVDDFQDIAPKFFAEVRSCGNDAQSEGRLWVIFFQRCPKNFGLIATL